MDKSVQKRESLQKILLLSIQAGDIFSNLSIDANQALELVQEVVDAVSSRTRGGFSLFPRDLNITNIILTNTVDILTDSLESEGAIMSSSEVCEY